METEKESGENPAGKEKKAKIEELLKRGNVNVRGYIYDIELRCEEVVLVPRGGGDEASSKVSYSDYGYSPGQAM